MESEDVEITIAEIESDRDYSAALANTKPDRSGICQNGRGRCNVYVVGRDRAEVQIFATHDEPSSIDGGIGYESFFFRYYLDRLTPVGSKLIKLGLLYTFNALAKCPVRVTPSTAMIGEANLTKTDFVQSERNFSNVTFNLGGPIETKSFEKMPKQVCMKDELPQSGLKSSSAESSHGGAESVQRLAELIDIGR